MITNIVYTLEIFIFIFCSLNVFKNLYNMIKVLRTKEGKMESSTSSIVFLGLSISYIITALIVGF